MSAEPDLLQADQPQAEQEPSPGGPASPGDPASPSKGACGLVCVRSGAGAESVSCSEPCSSAAGGTPQPPHRTHSRRARPAPQVLSINRVKAFIKEFGEVKSISTEACFLVAKATVRQG